jgi:hypothetical protein
MYLIFVQIAYPNLPLKLLLRQSVWMFFTIPWWSSHHWKASASDTPQQTRKCPQMDVVSMLKSKDALVPCRNLSFGKRLSLIAMEKAAAFPQRAGFMPNSPMPMLDVCDSLLLTTVSTTGGGSRLAPFLFGLVASTPCLLHGLGL